MPADFFHVARWFAEQGCSLEVCLHEAMRCCLLNDETEQPLYPENAK